MDFAEVVKTVRKDLSMSQEELAHAINVSFATINRWENGKTHPNNLTKTVFLDFCSKNGLDIDLFKDN
jgi:Predicted transcription factor, homolog of eukaryotic MBF1